MFTAIALLFKEIEDNKVKVSFRSTGKVDVMEISRQFSGGGHRMAAGAQLDGNIEEVMNLVVARVSAALELIQGVE